MAQPLNARLTVKNENIFHSDKMFRELIPVFFFKRALFILYFMYMGVMSACIPAHKQRVLDPIG